MAELLSNIVWEGQSHEMTDDLPEIADGQFFKQLDTGESYFRRNGEWAFINLGLSYIKATKSGLVTTDASGVSEVVFNTPFIDDDYTVALTCDDPGKNYLTVAYKSVVVSTGFTIQTRDKNGHASGNVIVSWLATRNYNP